MKNSTKILSGILVVLGALSPYVGPYLAQISAAHPALASLGLVLSSLGALLHNPKAA